MRIDLAAGAGRGAASTRSASASCSPSAFIRRCATSPAPRRELGVRTIFNLLGPLTNPAGARRQLARRLRARVGRAAGAGARPPRQRSARWSCTATTGSTRSRSTGADAWSPSCATARVRTLSRSTPEDVRPARAAAPADLARRRRGATAPRSSARVLAGRATAAQPTSPLLNAGGGALRRRRAPTSIAAGVARGARRGATAARARSKLERAGRVHQPMILDDIVAARRDDLARAKRASPLAALRERPLYRASRGAASRAALRARRPAVIAEVKKASPSRGVIRADFDPVAIARALRRRRRGGDLGADRGALLPGQPRAISRRSARAVDVPLLRKDFVFDPYQLVEARACGRRRGAADRRDPRRRAAARAARRWRDELGLDALVEVHTSRGARARRRAPARALIGINNRDLRTFVTTLDDRRAAAPLVPRRRAGRGRERHRDAGRRRAPASAPASTPSWSARR